MCAHLHLRFASPMVRINEGSSYSSGCSAVQTLSSADRVGSEHKLSSACIALMQSEGYVGCNGYSNEVSEYPMMDCLSQFLLGYIQVCSLITEAHSC